MQLTSILTVAILALGISAAPGTGVELENRNFNKCKYGEIYNAHWKTCSCPPKQEYIKNKCRYPPIKEPWCGKDQWGKDENKYCSKSKHHFIKYNNDHSWCEDDGKNVVFCSSHKELLDKLKWKYDNQLDCKDKQGYNCDKKTCECPKGMYWKHDEGKCRYPPVQKPKCEGGKEPWCGKSKKKYCKYDDKKDECEDDTSPWGFCSNDKDVYSVVNSNFDS